MAPNPTAHASASAAAGAHAPDKSKPGRPRSRKLKEMARSVRLPLRFKGGVGEPKRLSIRAQRRAVAKVSRPCGECGRWFLSERALFGHMRCHRGQQWRGGDGLPSPCQLPPTPPRVVSPSEPAPVGKGAADTEVKAAASCLVSMNGQDARLPVKTEWEEPDVHGLVVLVSAAVSPAARARGCGFDLNLPPPEEETEGGSSSSASLKVDMDPQATI